MKPAEFDNTNLQIRNEQEFLFKPRSSPVAMGSKLPKNTTPRFLEDEGLYVWDKPEVFRRNMNKMENRLLAEDKEQHWFGEDGKIIALPDPIKPSWNFRLDVTFKDVDPGLETMYKKAMKSDFESCVSNMGESDHLYQLDLFISSLFFTHHPLFNQENVLAVRLTQFNDYYQYRQQKNLTHLLTEKLKALVHTAETADSNLVANPANRKRIEDFSSQIRETAKQLDAEWRKDISVVQNILKVWKEIKSLRKLQGYVSTTLKLQVQRVEKDAEYYQKQYEENFLMNVAQLEQELQENYDKEMELYRRTVENREKEAIIYGMGENTTEEYSSCEPKEPSKPPSVFDGIAIEELRQRFEETPMRLKEPIPIPWLTMTAKLTPTSKCPVGEINRKAKIQEYSYFIKIFYNDKQVSCTTISPLQSNFGVQFQEIFNIKVLYWPESIRLEIFECTKKMVTLFSKLYLPIPNSSVLTESAELEQMEFSSDQKVMPEYEGVGSNIPFILGKNETEKICLLTSGKVVYSASWAVQKSGIPLVPPILQSKNYASSVLKNIDAMAPIGISWLDDLQKLVEWAKKARNDPNDPQNSDMVQLIVYASERMKNNPEYFRLNQLQEEFNFTSEDTIRKSKRFRLLELRNNKVLEFLNYKQIPLYDREISRSVFQKYDLQHVSQTALTTEDYITAQRIKAANYIKKNKTDFFTMMPKTVLRREGPTASCDHAGPQTTDSQEGEITLKKLFDLITDKSRKLEEAISQVNNKFDALTSRLNKVEERVDKTEKDLKEKGTQINQTESMSEQSLFLAKTVIKENRVLKRRLEQTENQLRGANFRIVGLPENIEQDDLIGFLEHWVPKILKLDTDGDEIYVERAYRIPIRRDINKEQRKTVVVRLSSEKDRDRILMAARKIKDIVYEGNKILFFPDLSPETQAQRKAFLSVRSLVKNKLLKVEDRYSLSDIVTSYEEIVTLSQLSLSIFKIVEPKRLLKPPRKERKKVLAQNLTDGDVKILVRINRAYNIPVRKKIIARSPGGDYSFPVLSKLSDKISISVFDEVAINTVEDEYFTGYSVNSYFKKNWIGSINIPVSSILHQSKVNGTFQLNTPPLLLGYDWNKTNAATGETINVPCQMENCLITVFVTINPQISYMGPDEDKEYKQNSPWLDLLARFVSLIPLLPDIEHADHTYDMWATSQPKPNAHSVVNNVGLNGIVEAYFIYFGYSYVQNDYALVFRLFLCEAYSFMLVFTQQFIHLAAGNKEEHAVLLCNYFLYLHKNAQILLGTSLLEGEAAYVLTQEGSNYTFWNPVTGKCYKQFDIFCPLQSGDCLISKENVWFSVQKHSIPMCMNFDTSDEALWRPLLSKSFPYTGLPIIKPLDIHYRATDPRKVEELRNRIERTLKNKIMEWRSQRPTRWNRYCTARFHQFLPLLETSCDTSAAGEQKAELEELLKDYKVTGFPIQMPYTDLQTVTDTVYRTGIHDTEIFNTEFALAVHIHPYPNNILSVWIYLASLISQS
nr:PREDICTED: coiled-coil and C2 domain-containing protein 2A [Latimeria chalumnae]|eukprot:XP_014341336.1 PREDICTED: coiled-coil and C2 domain-containing protein 2A [Latimeria chalumnae]